MAVDRYEVLIAALRVDADVPSDAVLTALPDQGVVNVAHPRTDTTDAWQVALPVDTPVADAILQVLEQQALATDRVTLRAHKATREAALTRINEDYQATVRAVTAARQARLATKRATLRRAGGPDEA